jgi:predicted ATP-dependent endonuclease of OLD family
MELKSFRVRNFRSINDSGEIDVSRITALLGRNESGKSNILRALHSSGPASGFTKLQASEFQTFKMSMLHACRDSYGALSQYEQGRL